MASYSESRYDGKYLGTYVCSHCKSVILRNFAFYAVGYSRMSMKKAKEAAAESAHQGIAALQAFQKKPFLVTAPVEDRSYWLVTGFGTEGLERGCPYCGHREAWQMAPENAANLPKDPETGVALVQDVPQLSRMFIVPAEGDDVQKIYLPLCQQVNEQSRKYWEEHPQDEAAVRTQLGHIQGQIEALTARKKAVQDNTKVLAAQISQKEAQMKGLPMFSGERKACKAELKELEKQYETQRMEGIQQEALLNKQIQEQECRKKEILIRYPGVLNELERIVPQDTQTISAIRLN